MPQDSWGKILQILLDGKTAVCASVHVDECERRPPQQQVLRVYGYDVHAQALAHQHHTVVCE